MNEVIERARQIGLDALQPSRKDLERGLELHKESVVIDAYGFSPVAAADGDALKALIEAGASHEEVKVAREDMGMTRKATDPAEREEFLAAFDAAGVTCIFQNAGEEGQAVKRLIRRLAHFTFTCDFFGEGLRRAVVPSDIEAAHASGEHCLYFSANGVPLAEEWRTVQEELLYIRIFFQLGVRMMHLTYNRRNMIGDGCAEPADAGLSDFGRAVIAEMNKQGVIVDCAHSGWRTSLEAAQASEKPMVASHSVACAVNEHIRGKPDEVIRAICDTGGYIGICCIPGFLGGKGDITALLDHIDYVARTFGSEHVAIGTDVAYVSRNQAAEARKAPSMPRARTPWRSFWPPNDPMFSDRWNDPKIRESLAWTNWPLFTVGLVQRGYTDDDIRNILGGNVLRVARAALEGVVPAA